MIKFELVADWNRWDAVERVEALLMSLDLDAVGYIQDLRGFRNFTYGVICAALDNHFGATRTTAADKQALSRHTVRHT